MDNKEARTGADLGGKKQVERDESGDPINTCFKNLSAHKCQRYT